MTFADMTIDLGGAAARIAQLQQAAEQANGYSAALVNSKRYAGAVERGYTRKRVNWQDLSKKQRYAILMAMKKRWGAVPKNEKRAAKKLAARSGKYKREGTKVERFDEPLGFSLHVPGAGMVSNSLPEIGQFMHQLAGQPLAIGTANPFERIVDETALWSLTPVSEKTPVDNGGGGLAGAWSVNTGYKA